jgi:pimeloyl-ACP methyl ester carboxylesterase
VPRVSNPVSPTLREVICASPQGLHRLAYAEWGDPRARRTVVCAHGLTRTGRDFDAFARALASDARVVCPDMIGRGRSSRTHHALYQVPQYVSDCVTLIARLDVESVQWVGTSMGGLIGMVLASMQGSPISRLVLNDVGPVVDADGMGRIAQYVGNAPDFESFDAGMALSRSLAAGFGPLTDAQWRELHEHYVIRRADGRWVFHYDPAIGTALREALAKPLAPLWPIYDAIRASTLLLRGETSDILTPEVASQMTARGPKARLVEFVGVGHAPALMSHDQISVVRDFLLAA